MIMDTQDTIIVDAGSGRQYPSTERLLDIREIEKSSHPPAILFKLLG